MEDGVARILTLKNSRILDNEGMNEYSLLVFHLSLTPPLIFSPQRMNCRMLKWQKKIVTKRIWKKRDYIGYGDNEFVDGKSRFIEAVHLGKI